MLNSKLVNKDFLTWLLIGWWLCCPPIRCQVWKSLLTNMDFSILVTQTPGILVNLPSLTCVPCSLTLRWRVGICEGQHSDLVLIFLLFLKAEWIHVQVKYIHVLGEHLHFFTHWSLGDVTIMVKVQSSNSCYRLISWAFPMKWFYENAIELHW